MCTAQLNVRSMWVVALFTSVPQCLGTAGFEKSLLLNKDDDKRAMEPCLGCGAADLRASEHCCLIPKFKMYVSFLLSQEEIFQFAHCI